MNQHSSSGIIFFVPGVPIAKGSMSAFPFPRKDGSTGARVTDKTKGLKPWLKTVKAMATRAMWSEGRKMFPKGTPIALSTQFYLERPESVKDRKYPTVKPDLGKLERAIEDALTGIIYEDDKDIVTRPNSQKRYRDEYQDHPRSPGVIITVTRQI